MSFIGLESPGRVAHPSPISIRSGVPHSSSLKVCIRELLKLKARSIFYRSQTRIWLKILNSHPCFLEYVRASPSFVHKIYRPYLTRAMSINERLKAFISHYDFIFEHGLGEITLQASKSGVVLATIKGKTGKPYDVYLRAAEPSFEREGELVLQLRHQEAILYSVVFAFLKRNDLEEVAIGCIQGPKPILGLEAVRSATRELYGLRPKQLLVSTVRQLAAHFGCTTISLVSNANRVGQRPIRRGHVLSNYDEFWLEIGAQQHSDGDFRLACSPLSAPDFSRIESKKRSAVRHRHEVLVHVAGQVCDQFKSLARVI